MTFIVICSLLLLLRLCLKKIIPWRLISVSTSNLAGTILFIGLGLEYNTQISFISKILIVTAFYASILTGEFVAKLKRINKKGLKRSGKTLLQNPFLRYSLLLFFIVFSIIPLFTILNRDNPLKETLRDTWATRGVEERGESLVEYSYGHKEQKGFPAFVIAIQRQLTGFWYLSVGMVFLKSPFVTSIGIILYTAGFGLSSTGSRSQIFILFSLLALLLSSKSKNKTVTIFFLVLFSLSSLILLDVLLQGRQGLESHGKLSDRLSRVLIADFAFGGRAVELAQNSRPANLSTGIDYILQLAVFPIPRFILPNKPIKDPNWEMTENYFDEELWIHQNITLFSPLGEALFYFGTFGLIIIPLLYGLLTGFLERVYLSSKVYKGLLFQVYIWSFLGMRHTFWNIFGALFVSNILAIIFIYLIKYFGRKYRVRDKFLLYSDDKSRIKPG